MKENEREKTRDRRGSGSGGMGGGSGEARGKVWLLVPNVRSLYCRASLRRSGDSLCKPSFLLRRQSSSLLHFKLTAFALIFKFLSNHSSNGVMRQDSSLQILKCGLSGDYHNLVVPFRGISVNFNNRINMNLSISRRY